MLPFFQWCEATAIGTAIRSSPWAFAVIESVHLLGLSVIGGAVLLVDFRLLGLGLTAAEDRDDEDERTHAGARCNRHANRGGL